MSRASAKLEYFDSEDEECTQVGEHIHDKLLKHGLSHRQAVVVLYGASAAFGLVSLSLISASLTLVAVSLTIVGVSVAFGLQRLGYREMDEIWRVARSTWQQKTIISNSLAVWRATDHLATATTPQDVSCILKTAFQETDYDGFEYSFTPKAAFREETYGKLPAIAHVWRKESSNGAVGWTLQLDLVSRNGQICGRFAASRRYSSRPSHRGTIDCLTSEFAMALAASLERIADEQLASSASALSSEKRMLTVADAA